VVKHRDFPGWDAWMEYNHKGYDAVVTFRLQNQDLTIISDNCGIFVKNTVEMNSIGRPLYASITGDEVAITNIRVIKKA
jgi:hypothetical protein